MARLSGSKQGNKDRHRQSSGSDRWSWQAIGEAVQLDSSMFQESGREVC